jgi:hypothetical protein
MWRSKYGGLEASELKRLKELEQQIFLWFSTHSPALLCVKLTNYYMISINQRWYYFNLKAIKKSKSKLF